jgi:histidinol-phosphatase (PHP family)
MVKTNYHTHTYRCGHAVGEDEDYIREALAMGLTELGFTDHIMLPYHSQPGIRPEYNMLDDYVESLRALKEKYKDRITIHIGFEAEAMKEYFDYYKELLDSGKVEYLICGNHCEVNGDHLKFFFSSATTKDDIKRYTSSLIKGMKSGLFKFIAHPDYYMGSYLKWDRVAKSCAKKIIRTAKKLDIPLEFNFGSIRKGKQIIGDEYRFGYPYDKFWEMVKKAKCKVVFGLDAHAPTDLSNLNNDAGYKMAKELGLEPLQKLDF